MVSFAIIGSQLTGVLRSVMELICARSRDTVPGLAAVRGSCNGSRKQLKEGAHRAACLPKPIFSSSIDSWTFHSRLSLVWSHRGKDTFSFFLSSFLSFFLFFLIIRGDASRLEFGSARDLVIRPFLASLVCVCGSSLKAAVFQMTSSGSSRHSRRYL